MLKLNNVSKNYGSTKALSNVTLSICEHESIGIVGRNGSGKTTLFDIALGLTKPTSGDIKWNVAQEDVCKIVGVQMQDGYFESLLKVKEICKLFCHIYGLSYSVARELYKTLDVEHISGRYLTKLSGGERQKINILLSLLHDPSFLFYDEISTGLDAVSRDLILDILLNQKKQGKTIVLVSHYFEEIWTLCDRIVVLNSGQCVYNGEKNALGKDYHTFKQSILGLMG